MADSVSLTCDPNHEKFPYQNLGFFECFNMLQRFGSSEWTSRSEDLPSRVRGFLSDKPDGPIDMVFTLI